MAQTYIRKQAPFEAMQFDGTKEKAQEIINWILPLQHRTDIFFAEEVPAWESADGRMAHKGVPPTLLLGGEHVRAGDWVAMNNPVLGHFYLMPNEEFEENIILYDAPTPEPTGHEEASDPIHGEVSNDVDQARTSYSGFYRNDSEA